MSIKRSFLVLAAIALPHTLTRAQEAGTQLRREHLSHGAVHVLHDQDGAQQAKFTLWASYPTRDLAFQDHAQYLADLQARFGDQGIAIAVVLPKEDAEFVAKTRPRMVVATAEAPEQLADIKGMLCVITAERSGKTLFAEDSLDLAVDIIQQCLAGEHDDQPHRDAREVLLSMWTHVADGGNYDAASTQCLASWPHSGRAHACAVLTQWWCRGDLEGADKAIQAGLRALGNEAVPMAIFVDLVMRGDGNDPTLANQLAMAMAPIAAGASEGPFTQLVYLRALLRAGQNRLAGRITATLPKRIAYRPELQLVFAETLMEGDQPGSRRDLAKRAIDSAEAYGGAQKWCYAARHKLLKRCGDDEAAEKLMDEYRAKHLSSGLNNDAWYLIVQPETMGRYDTMALAQCHEMLRVEPDIDFGSMDTVALAHFVNGFLEKAIEMQTAATKQSGNDAIYVARLKRYQATFAAQEARAQAAREGK